MSLNLRLVINPQQDGDSESDILARARERFTKAAEAEAEVRKEAVDDLKFVSGDQWPEDVKTARQLDKRPCLTINRLPEYVRQVTNEQRQSRPAIKVNPVDDNADIETAEIIQGMVRHIEYVSNAEIAYDTASDGQVRNGFGYFRLITQYVEPMSFEQEILIKRIRDPFSVYMDPDFTEPDGCDINYAFIIDTMSKDQYRQMFPDSKLSQFQDWSAIGSSTSGWMNKDECQIAEYYEKTLKRVKIYKLDDGRTVQQNQIPPELFKIIKGEAPAPEGFKVPRIVEERETDIPKIIWYKINGVEILDQTEVFGSYIPIVPVLGDEIFVNGKKILESVVRHAKDPQRMYNYWATAETEMIALAPKAPFIGYEGQFEGFEQQWQSANNKSFAFLQVKPIVLPGGGAAPLPQRNVYEPPVQAISNARTMSIEDIKATTGIYDAEMGNHSQEQSGVAIQRRVQQSNTSNFHFGDNFKRSLRHAGRIIVEWIPHVYSEAQAIRVLGADGQQKIVKINQVFHENGEEKSYYLGEGRYDVTVDTGPSYQTKRQEAVASMLDLTKSIPETMKNALDLLVMNMDWPEAQKIAARLKKTLPPGMAEPDQKDGEKPIPPEVQQALMQGQQIMQQQSQLIGEQDEVIRTKKLELESKERIELEKLRNNIVIEQMKHDAAHAQLAFEKEIAMIQQRLDLTHANQPIVQSESPGPQAAGSSGNNQPSPGGASPA